MLEMSFNPIIAARNLASYQFGLEIANALFREDLIERMKVKFSGRTRRMRYIFLDDKPYLSVRTSDGFFTLSLSAAQILLESLNDFDNLVKVYNEFVKLILLNKEVLAKQVKEIKPWLKANSEVVVVDENKKLIGVGRTLLNGDEIIDIKRGAVIKLRKVVRNV